MDLWRWSVREVLLYIYIYIYACGGVVQGWRAGDLGVWRSQAGRRRVRLNKVFVLDPHLDPPWIKGQTLGAHNAVCVSGCGAASRPLVSFEHTTAERRLVLNNYLFD